MDAMRTDQLVDEARLPDSGLADDRHDLALSLSGLPERSPELVDLRFPSHEAAEPPDGRDLESRPPRGGTGQLVDLDRLRQSLIWTGPRGRTSTYPSARRSVPALMKVDPGDAICSRRAARCVVCPTAE